MDIDALRLVVEVARAGSFAAAARARDTDPSSVSRQVARTERALGFRLFQRSTRRLTLSEAGAAFVERLGIIIEELDGAADAGRAVTRGATGTLRLTTSVAFGTAWLVPRLRDFQDRHPELAVELVLTDDPLDLINERIDLAIRMGASVTGDLVCARLMSTAYRVVAAPAWVSRHGAPDHPTSLSAYDVLRLPFPGFRTHWRFLDAGGVETVVPVSGRTVISSAIALRAAARAGNGPALLADWLIDTDVAAGRLVDLFPAYRVAATSFDTAVWLVYPSRRLVPVKVQVAVAFLRAQLAASRNGHGSDA